MLNLIDTKMRPEKSGALAMARDAIESCVTIFARYPLAAILALGLALRAFWWLKYPAYNSPDAIVYLREADHLFATGWIENDTYMPLYPILVHLAGANGILLLQIALSAASIYLGFLIARDIWSRSAGLAAAFMLAVHPMLIYYVTFRLTETAFIFFVLLGFVCIYRNLVWAAAVAFVLANLVRPSLDLVYPLILVAGSFATIPKPSLAVIARRLAIYAMVYCALMSPWWLHNEAKYHRLVRLDLAGGIIMLLENNEQFERVGLDWSKLTFWQPFAGIADPVDKDIAMRKAAIAYIETRPLMWLRGDIDRLRRFLTPSDVAYNMLQRIVSAILLIVIVLGALAAA